MHLKRVSMCGFKSFADKVDFDFAPGVTCIVGPNGCGKSNVVDAFKWVLGEQSAKSLRGRQMLDMIFNGSSSRRSAGMSQVDLAFDNIDRTLPIDRDEVVITRKLFRSGESEYLICMEPARLKDVRELFMDTGIGANAYAVIEQGKVDVLLQSSPADRRAILEEAAGISKYKARKKEAERKLERTQQNLLRVADVIEEVERRLRSVKLQAGKARNFKEYDTRLRELRASFSMAEYHRLTQSIGQIREQVDTDQGRASQVRGEIQRAEEESARVGVEADKLAHGIADCDHRLSTVRSDASAQKERMDSSRSRIEEQTAGLHRAESRCNDQNNRLDEQQAQLSEAEAKSQALADEIDQHDIRIEELAVAEQALAREAAQTQAIVEDEKAGVIDLLRRTAQLHNEITALTKHSDALADQRGRLNERDAIISTELQSLLERKSSLRQKHAEVERLIEIENQRLEEKKQDARRIDADHARLVEASAAAKEARSALRSRQQVLQDLQNRMEGVGAGARRILDRKTRSGDDGSLNIVLGLVADVFETDVHRAQIVEAALGEHDQDLVVTDSRAFLRDPEIAGGLPERTTAQCLDRLQPVMNIRDFSDQPGFVAPVLDFVRYPDSLEILARNLLGKTVVVDTLDNALHMSADDTYGHRFVTLRGEVVEADGRVRVGPPQSHAGLISRMTELRSIDDQLAGLDQQVESLAGELNQASAQAAHLEQVQQELRTAIYELHTARVETNAGIDSLAESIRKLTSEKPLLEAEAASIEQQLAEAAARTSQSASSLTRLEADSQQRETRVVEYQQRLEQINADRVRASESLTEARVAAGKLIEKRTSVAQLIGALRRGIRETQQALSAAEHEIAECTARIAESRELIAQCERRLVELTAQAEQIEAEGAGLRAEREGLRRRQEELAAAVRTHREVLSGLEQQLHEHQLALHEAGIRRDELSDRVKAELEIDLAALYPSYEHSDQDWQAIEAEIADLRQKIHRLGNINLDAIGEQEELEERLAFLTSQRDDLDNARAQLDTLIEELNVECRERFAQAFEAIRENFRELFRKLFGGGKADMILENPDDVLESGIEILARPPGKELQSISLLSGGEKSLTAIALLMAIFRSRPSPFAILDEVDAALDESNNERFNGIIREFLDRSQFIVISHSKRTMSIADQMYGVTMQEPGVSTRVSVRFDDVGRAGRSAVA